MNWLALALAGLAVARNGRGKRGALGVLRAFVALVLPSLSAGLALPLLLGAALTLTRCSMSWYGAVWLIPLLYATARAASSPSSDFVPGIHFAPHIRGESRQVPISY